MNLIEQLKEEVKYFFEESDGCHDWEHTERVFNLSMHIGKIENADIQILGKENLEHPKNEHSETENRFCDLEILGIAAILHDIGRPEESKSKGKICHAQIGSKLAEEILKRHNFSSEKIKKIKHCIETHRSSKSHSPESKEAKILFDADKLDSLGAIGVGRIFAFAATHGAKIHNSPLTNIEETESYTKEDTAYREYYHKLKKVKDKLFTNEGKRIAKERHEFMELFFNRINKEVLGEI